MKSMNHDELKEYIQTLTAQDKNTMLLIKYKEYLLNDVANEDM